MENPNIANSSKVKTKTCTPPQIPPPGNHCKTNTPSAGQNGGKRSESKSVLLESGAKTIQEQSIQGAGRQSIDVRGQSVQEFSPVSSSAAAADCKRYNFLKLLQPGNAGISQSNCCPYGGMQFPCSWFASPKYFHMCTTRRCCKTKCVFHDERKVCGCVGSKCNELGPRVSSNTLHGVRSVNDLRSWSVSCEDQRRYFLEQMLKSRGPVDEVQIEDDIPQEASPMQIRYENLLNKKDDEIERLKKQILELQQKKTEPVPSRKQSRSKTPPRQKSVEFADTKSEYLEKEAPEPEQVSSLPRKKSSLVDTKAVASLPRKKSSLVDTNAVALLPAKKSSLVDTKAVASLPGKKSSLVDTNAVASLPRKQSSMLIEENESKDSESETVTTSPTRKSSGYKSIPSSPKKVSEEKLEESKEEELSEVINEGPTEENDEELAEEIKVEPTEKVEEEPLEEVKEEPTEEEVQEEFVTSEAEEELFPDASETRLDESAEKELSSTELEPESSEQPEALDTPASPPEQETTKTPVAVTLPEPAVLPESTLSKTPLVPPTQSLSQPLVLKETAPPPPTKQKSLPHFTPIVPGLLHEPRKKKDFLCSSCEMPKTNACPCPPVDDEGFDLRCDLGIEFPIEDPYNVIVKIDGNKIVKSQGGQVLEVLEPEELVAELEWLRESMVANGERVYELEDALYNRGEVGYDYDQYGAQIEQLNSQLEIMKQEHNFLESRLVEKEANEKHLHTTLESTAGQLNQYREDSERSRTLLMEADDRIQSLVRRIMELEAKAGGMLSDDMEPRHPPGPCGQLAVYLNNSLLNG